MEGESPKRQRGRPKRRPKGFADQTDPKRQAGRPPGRPRVDAPPQMLSSSALKAHRERKSIDRFVEEDFADPSAPKRRVGRPPGSINRPKVDASLQPSGGALRVRREKKPIDRFFAEEYRNGKDKDNPIGKRRGRPPIKEATRLKVDHAQKLFENLLIEEDVSLSAADYLKDLFPRMFPDSRIAARLYQRWNQSSSTEATGTGLRKRGRPKLTHSDDTDSNNQELSRLTSKRRRGRPFKVGRTDSFKGSINSVPRKRGRPKARLMGFQGKVRNPSGFRRRGRPRIHDLLQDSKQPHLSLVKINVDPEGDAADVTESTVDQSTLTERASDNLSDKDQANESELPNARPVSRIDVLIELTPNEVADDSTPNEESQETVSSDASNSPGTIDLLTDEISMLEDLENAINN